MNEALLNMKWSDGDLTTDKGEALSVEIMNHMRNRLQDYQEKYGDLFNLEATPAESTTYRFAKHDRADFPDIITAAKNGQAPYYTNSTHLPVGYTDDIFDALEKEDEMQTLYTSGTVFHAFLGERLPDWKACAHLVRKIAENFKLPYYTMSPTYSVCEEHGYISGEHFKCPICGKETEVYSRITGYYRPIKNWNDGKLSEFKNRNTYEPEELNPEKSGQSENLDDSASGCDRSKDSNVNSQSMTIEASVSADREVIVLSTHSCPKCKMTKEMLTEAGIPFESAFAEDEDGKNLAVKYHVMSVPVLFVKDGNDEPVMINSADKISEFIDQNKKIK
jgi:ribonucleoside-triphosphate reductase